MTEVNIPELPSFIAPIFFFVAVLSLYWTFKLRSFANALRVVEPHTWVAIGKPNISWSFSPMSANRLERFIAKKGYASVQDTGLKKEAMRLMIVHRVYILSVAVLCLFMFAPLLLNAVPK